MSIILLFCGADGHQTVWPMTTKAKQETRVAAIDSRRLDQFLQSVERRAYGMAYVVTSQREDALDIVQEAMMKFAKKYCNKPEPEWMPLFYRVMQNQIRDWQRREIVRSRWRSWFGSGASERENEHIEPLQSLNDPRAEDPLRETVNDAALSKLQSALANLPTRQQQVFLLRAWEGLDVASTAKAMSVSEGSVKTHYSRALQALRKQLEDHWP